MRYSKLTEQQQIQTVEDYKTGKFSLRTLAKRYGISHQGIKGVLQRRGVTIDVDRTCRIYTIDHNYFNKIDSEEKAYILGFLYADGYNYEKRGKVSISLQERDKFILERMNIAFQSNSPIEFIDFSIKRPNSQNQYRITVNSRIFSIDLAKLGCFQCKSLTLKFPTEEQVPKHLLRHFIRGSFDGDGGIMIYLKHKKKTIYPVYTVSLVSTNDFCLDAQKFIKEDIGANSQIYEIPRFKGSNHPTRVLQMGGNQQVYKFLQWLYSDSTIFLSRKMDKFLEIEKALKERVNASPGPSPVI